ncbi:MAG: hypothetical protein R2873_31260 [Caldilineaceae bacterium]
MVDVTDEEAVPALGEDRFVRRRAVQHGPLRHLGHRATVPRALSRLLKPGGVFIYTMMHPCFNNPFSAHVAEMEDRDGEMVTTYSMKVWGYMTPAHRSGLALEQPKPHVYFSSPATGAFSRPASPTVSSLTGWKSAFPWQTPPAPAVNWDGTATTARFRRCSWCGCGWGSSEFGN